MDTFCRLFVRSMACRRFGVLKKCGAEAANLIQTYTELVGESLPKVLDVVYFSDGVTPVFLNNCMDLTNSNTRNGILCTKVCSRLVRLY